MSISDPEQTDREHDGEREDAPLPTRFGRDRHRRRRRPAPARAEGASGEPRPAPDDAPPFEDDGGL